MLDPNVAGLCGKWELIDSEDGRLAGSYALDVSRKALAKFTGVIAGGATD
jgi:hypothetical protein